MFRNQFVLCVRYRTKELEASGKQVGLKTIFLFRTRRTHFRRGKKKRKTKTETVIIITTTNTC